MKAFLAVILVLFAVSVANPGYQKAKDDAKALRKEKAQQRLESEYSKIQVKARAQSRTLIKGQKERSKKRRWKKHRTGKFNWQNPRQDGS